jgi:hypothetical protein
MRISSSVVKVIQYCFVSALFFFGYGISQASAATYYVSPTGNDVNPGTSTTSAWQTIAKVNSVAFKAGDKILLEGGKTFSGSLSFNASDTGTAASPIVLSNYGTGRATVSSGASTGVFVYNTGGFSIKNINFVGAGYPTNPKPGIMFYTDLPGNVKLPKISVDNVNSSKYYEGISVGAWNGTTGYNGINITNTKVFNNAQNGIQIYGYDSVGDVYPHTNLYMANVYAYDNVGIPNTNNPSGNGILVGQVNHGVIERSVAYNNGAKNTHNGGPVGFILYGDKDVVMQYNESHHNHTNSTADGGGLDIDGSVINSVIQYNYSHDNDGPGLMFAQYPTATTFSGNVIRYNVSQNDARKNGYGAITVWNGNGTNGVANCYVYNNTVYIDAASTTPSAIEIIGDQAIDVQFKNNILYTKNSVPVIVNHSAPANLAVSFINNNYWTTNTTPIIKWGGTTYTSLATWQTGTGQEMQGGVAKGFSVAPKFTAPGTGGTINNPALVQKNLTAYSLSSSSPMIDRAVVQAVTSPVSVATTDYSGDSLPQGTSSDLGADEFKGTAAPVVQVAAAIVPLETTSVLQDLMTALSALLHYISK